MMPTNTIVEAYSYVIAVAKKVGNDVWLDNLAGFIANQELFLQLSHEDQEIMREHYTNLWGKDKRF